jgi:hypothetical protein
LNFSIKKKKLQGTGKKKRKNSEEREGGRAGEKALPHGG